MNAYIRGDNPLTDYTKDYGQYIGYLRSFVTWAQQPSKSKCAYKVKRYNFKISEKSEYQWLYLVATFAKPEAHFKVLLKTDPPDSDHEVETSRANPFCSEQNYSSWGMVHKKAFLLTKIPE